MADDKKREETSASADDPKADARKSPGSIHKGHRQRLKEEFLAQGLEKAPAHKVLELLLFYAIPQGDVNPLAHRLIERFGSLSGVFQAEYDELLKVKGMGPNAASLIRLLPAVYARYETDRADIGQQLLCSTQYYEVLRGYFCGARKEICYLLCMDGKEKYINCCKLGEGMLDQVNVPVRRVMEEALRNNASRVVLAHNHVSGIAIPSDADKSYTLALKRILREVGILLVDHLVIVDGDMVSMAESGYLDLEYNMRYKT